MKLVIPRGTPLVNFDPHSTIAPLNVRAVFNDHVARSLWFMLENDNGSEPSTRDCILLLNHIQSVKVSTPEELETALRTCRVDVPEREAVQQLFDAITQIRPIKYRVMSDGPKQMIARW
ncbi:MAG: hypothetical protein JWL80_641 [Parcubacteria group bacterium]|nr:hypothetical protein [Parcubacteria group bacterium]